MPKKQTHLRGNSHATKDTRKIEIGWLNFDNNGFHQVKKSNGGGTRKIDMKKNSKKDDIIEEAISRFFPDGKSLLGSLSSFEIELRDFSEQVLHADDTIREMYEKTGLNMLRFYLATKKRSDTKLPLVSHSKAKRKRSLPGFESPIHDATDTIDLTDNTENPNNQSAKNTHDLVSSPESSPLPDLGEYFQSPLNWDEAFVDTNIGQEASIGKSATKAWHVREEDVSFNIPSDVVVKIGTSATGEPSHQAMTAKGVEDEKIPSGQNEASTLYIPVQAKQNLGRDYFERETSVTENVHLDGESTSDSTFPSILTRADDLLHKETDQVEIIVHRGSTAFFEVLSYFKDPNITSKIITVKRILPNGEAEVAEDSGGVIRDMISEFWTAFYDMCTIGKDAKVPALRHDLGNSEWQAVGRILLYGYQWISTGYWPVKLSKAFLMSIITSEAVDGSLLIEDLWKFVAPSDGEVLKQACEDFASVNEDDLMDSLDCLDCKTSPTAENIKSIILQIAHTVLIQKPTFVSNCFRDELMKAKMDKATLEEIYKKTIPTTRKVIALFQFPETMTASESDVAKYLKKYIKDIEIAKLEQFLRYCTGSDILTVEKILVEFTSLTGTERRPIAHTCGCVLQLPRSYESYMDFRYEFDSILSHNIWIMDIV